jgi:hypothetical protein
MNKPEPRRALAVSTLLVLAAAVSGAAAQIPPDGIIGPGQTVTIGPGAEVHRAGPIVVSGGTLVVNQAKLFLNGHLWVVHGGAVVFDAGEFHHEGNDTHVFVGGLGPDGGTGSLAFRNGSRLHFVQSYVSQHELQARNNSTIELTGTHIDCDAATGVIRLFDSASYTGTATSAARIDDIQPGCWMTTYMQQQSLLSLQSVIAGGDIVFYDAVQINVRDTIGTMPWLYFPAGSVADLSFPDASHCDPTGCPLVSKTIDSTSVPGIAWSVNIVNSGLVFWGFNSYPGSSVTVHDSALTMGIVRFAGDHSYFVPGEFHNNSSYTDKTFTSVPDRVLRLINTSMKWWKLDVIESAQARFDSVTFAEMMVKNSGRALVTNSICEGQTIHLGAIDDGYVYFKDGEVWTHVSAWGRALMVLDRSLVDWQKAEPEFRRQTRNIAHDRARLYALNSELIVEPEAMESALVTFARLGAFTQPQLETTAATWTPITGSAWIAKGPDSGVTFDRWVLAVRAPGASTWTNFASGTTEVRDAGLAWLASWLIPQPGNYELRLSLLVNGDDPLTPYPTWTFPAIKKLIVK